MSEHEPVNPAAPNEGDAEEAAEKSQGVSRDGDQSSQHARQSEQNQDANTKYDPTNGRRPDQARRNDKQGQMGG